MTRGYRIALAGCLVLAGLVDSVSTTSPFLIASFVVTALAVVALVRPDDHLLEMTVAGSLLLTVGFLVVGVAIFGLAEAGTLVLLVVASIRRADQRRHWIVTVLLAVAVLVLPFRLGLTPSVSTITAGLAVVVAVAVTVGSALRRADDARRAAVTAVRRAEREEVARELHDVVAHHVTGMVVSTQAARVVTAQADPRLDPMLASIEAAGVEALAAMRRLVDVLRSDPGARVDPGDARGRGRRAPVPQGGELGDLVRRFGVATDAGSVELRGEPEDLADLPGELRSALYRVTQEALTNTARHAPGAQRVVVDVARDSHEVSVRITDSGAPGAHPPRVAGPAGGGFGLIGMRERVDALGGSLTVGPHDGGWSVRVAFPDPAAGRFSSADELPARRALRRKGPA